MVGQVEHQENLGNRVDTSPPPKIDVSSLKIPDIKSPALAPDNVLLFWIGLEDLPELQTFHAQAIDNLNSLVTKIKDQLRDDPRPINEKMLAVYEIAGKEGYKLEIFAETDPLGGSLSYSFYNKKFDCDTSSALVVGVAQELGWSDIKSVGVHRHLFLRRNGINIDQGQNPEDSYYVQSYKSEPSKHEIDAVLGLKAEAWLVRGVLLYNFGRYDDAREAWSNSLSIRPDSKDVYYLRGMALARLGRLDDAVSDFTKEIALQPDLADAYRERGNNKTLF